MLINYFKIALRNLSRSKLFSSINLFGLAIGMACCMLLLLYILSELSFDKHHRHAKDIYIIRSESYFGGSRKEGAAIAAPYAFTLKQYFPEVEQSTRLFVNMVAAKTLLQTHEDGKIAQSIYEDNGYAVDSTFFDVFTYRFAAGNPATALQEPNTIVLSENTAQKLFGSESAINKTVTVGGTTGNGEPFKVTGVFKSENSRSHINANFFVPISSGWVGQFLRGNTLNFSYNNMFYTYLRLRPGTNAKQLERKLPAYMERFANNDLKVAGFKKYMHLLPVADIHLYSAINSVVTSTNSKTYLYILGCIAAFTLIIACINFMNLSTARSAKRAVEVGVRKVLGAEKSELVKQFLGESMVLCLLSLIIALFVVALVLPSFNLLTGKSFTISDVLKPSILSCFVLLAIATGFIAGSYPAFYLSVFKPAQVLKGRFANSISATSLRKGLVVFQFVISIVLVLATLIIQKQMKFMHDQPLGFTQDQQVIIPLRSAQTRAAYTGLKNDIMQSNLVLGVSGADYYPGIFNASDFSVRKPEQNMNEVQLMKTNAVAPDYLQMMGFELKQGRLFSRDIMSDTNNKMVVNEATLNKFSIPADKAIGQKLLWGAPGSPEFTTLEIVGVVKDFHFEDLHHSISPYAFFLASNTNFNYLIVHAKTANMDKLLNMLSDKWKKYCADEPFDYSFLDQDFQRNYNAEVKTMSIVSIFTGISIFISCLGLFGLAVFTAQQRTKEIGIRKVLGASVINITTMLSKDFVKLVLVAIVIASPLAYYFMHEWLNDFAYRTNINVWVFMLAAFVAIAFALITVSIQAVRSAMVNPVESLRTE
ncbi:ABC transporter permease [Pinibacter aurantiacus]|uniref:ABC transporter permease n=1 Tax=Pinibacter aurantiacus TaxID=2851599 RepID=A0A9E2W551_9BACT|nr:ABC transporter permease [Pinibacter aurantiacus]MBV4358534.1 ABC transporter permease [Pinibacter aurantiacus]